MKSSPTIDQVTSAWLTTVLLQDGALVEGAVTSFESALTVRELSMNARLKITYTADAAGDRPDR